MSRKNTVQPILPGCTVLFLHDFHRCAALFFFLRGLGGTLRLLAEPGASALYGRAVGLKHREPGDRQDDGENGTQDRQEGVGQGFDGGNPQHARGVNGRHGPGNQEGEDGAAVLQGSGKHVGGHVRLLVGFLEDLAGKHDGHILAGGENYGQQAGEKRGDDQRAGLSHQNLQPVQDGGQDAHLLQELAEGKAEEGQGDRGHHAGDAASVEEGAHHLVGELAGKAGGHGI